MRCSKDIIFRIKYTYVLIILVISYYYLINTKLMRQIFCIRVLILNNYIEKKTHFEYFIYTHILFIVPVSSNCKQNKLNK